MAKPLERREDRELTPEELEFEAASEAIFSEDADKMTNDEIAKKIDKTIADRSTGTDDKGGHPDKDQPGSNQDADDPDNSKSAQATADGADKTHDGVFIAAGDDDDTDPDTAEDTGSDDGSKKNGSNKDLDDGKDARIAELEAELEKEKHRTSSWSGRLKKSDARVKELMAEVQTLTETVATLESARGNKDTKDGDGSQETDKEILDRFREDFPEMGEVLDILDRRISSATKGGQADTAPAKKPAYDPDAPLDDPNDSTASTNADTTLATGKTHMEVIEEAHPDMSEIVGSGVLKTWVNKQADFIRPRLIEIYNQGSSKEVIEMVTQFKKSTGWKSKLDDTTNTGDDSAEAKRQRKLESMKAVDSSTGGPKGGKKQKADKDDFMGTAKEIGLV